MEVILGGFAQPEEIVETAIQEDVEFIGYRIMDREPIVLVSRLRDLLDGLEDMGEVGVPIAAAGGRAGAPGGRSAAGAERIVAEAVSLIDEDPRAYRAVLEAARDRALHGLTRKLLANMAQGVGKGFSRNLEINGVGYRADRQHRKRPNGLRYHVDTHYATIDILISVHHDQRAI